MSVGCRVRMRVGVGIGVRVRPISSSASTPITRTDRPLTALVT